jgi:phosphatidate cytidylyltransferase
MSERELKPRSDLGVRTVSGVAMMAVLIASIWLGDWVLGGLVLVVAFGVMLEWTRLVSKIYKTIAAKLVWDLAGLTYVGIASFALLRLGAVITYPGEVQGFMVDYGSYYGRYLLIIILLLIVATDVGAYFAGRLIGGPKIAPKISPSKTWAGLGGATIASGLALWFFLGWNLNADRQVPAVTIGISDENLAKPYGSEAVDFLSNSVSLTDLASHLSGSFPLCLFVAFVFATLAQSGDFFESWMKRKAGVKDSGNLIPGHGGLFDRTDGLIAVSFIIGCLFILGLLRL